MHNKENGETEQYDVCYIRDLCNEIETLKEPSVFGSDSK